MAQIHATSRASALGTSTREVMPTSLRSVSGRSVLGVPRPCGARPAVVSRSSRYAGAPCDRWPSAALHELILTAHG